MKVFIDKIDVSELLLDIKYESDLSGSSRSSIFGSIETEQLELVVKNKHDGERLYIDDEEYAITECDYDEKSERTTVKAITDLRALDDEFELVGGASSSEEKVISFKDFELTGNKPNLIPNGWDSFEPYGNEGEKTKAPLEVFNNDYIRNYLTVSNVELGSISYATGELRDETTRLRSTIFVDVGTTNELTYYSNGTDFQISLRYYDKNNNFLSGDMRWNGDKTVFKMPVNTNKIKLVIRKSNYNVLDSESLLGSGISLTNSEKSSYLAWEDIPEKDKPVQAWSNMAVHMTPLENGLTRIQTWGGSQAIKLVNSDRIDVSDNDYITQSMMIQNIGHNNVVWRDNRMNVFQRVVPGTVEYVTLEGNIPIPRLYSNIRVDNVTDNLDFIASSPTIVEGDVANAVMTVDTLPDGKEEVNIYGANDNTELVYKADAVTGEPYELYGDIDNQGRELKLSSTLGDSDIKKGENQVNLKGDAKNREVTIKIGVA